MLEKVRAFKIFSSCAPSETVAIPLVWKFSSLELKHEMKSITDLVSQDRSSLETESRTIRNFPKSCDETICFSCSDTTNQHASGI